MSARICSGCWDAPAAVADPIRQSLDVVMVDLDILTARPDLHDMAAPGVVRAMALRSEA